MKRLLLKSVTVLIVIALSLSALVGCANKVSGKEARATFDAFLTAVDAENYEAARIHLHPLISGTNLSEYFATLREEKGIDFTEGISEVKLVGFYAAFYDTAIDGSSYEMELHAKTVAGDVPIYISCTVVRNDDGYGIYNFIVDGR